MPSGSRNAVTGSEIFIKVPILFLMGYRPCSGIAFRNFRIAFFWFIILLGICYLPSFDLLLYVSIYTLTVFTSVILHGVAVSRFSVRIFLLGRELR
jgi:hypothetical protein